MLRTSKALGDETRLSIYRYLDAAPEEALSVNQLAEHFELHPNAVRQHLAKLEEAGLVVSQRATPTGSGRPQRLYRKRNILLGNGTLPRDFRLLSEMLLEFLATSGVTEGQLKAFGRRWGGDLVKEARQQLGEFITQDMVARLLRDRLLEWGFEPNLHAGLNGNIRVQVNNCIFHGVTPAYQKFVCSLMQGVIEGMIASTAGEHELTVQRGIVEGRDSCMLEVQLSTA